MPISTNILEKSDPNGHNHGPKNNFKSNASGEEKGMEAMMKPFMGFSKLYSPRHLDKNRLNFTTALKCDS